LSIEGTPGLVFQNGKVIGGAIPSQQIEALLKAAAGS
jgi:protein-disulfide isomerase